MLPESSNVSILLFPRYVSAAGEKLGCGSPAGLVLAIDVPSLSLTMKQPSVSSTDQGGGSGAATSRSDYLVGAEGQ